MVAALIVACASLAGTNAIKAQPSTKTGAKAPADLKIAYTRFVLPNGLVVLLHEDHSAPIVALHLQYHVGTRDEVPGKRGLAHMFEHMMFEGSANVAPEEFGRIIAEAGGRKNGNTSNDLTMYYEQVPSNMLDMVLWLEAERMATLPARLDSARFEIARQAVVNEYTSDFNNPGMPIPQAEAFLTGLYPDPHPYTTLPYGVMSELASTTVKDLRAFFDKYYAPNNAVLAIAGDFNAADARKKVAQYFGGISRRAAVVTPTIKKVPLTKEVRFVLENKRNTTQLWIGWHGAQTNNPDRVALTALSGILTRRTSALSRALVDDKKLATPLSPGSNGHYDLEGSGIFQIVINARANTPMTEIERTVDSVVAAVRENGVSEDELRRWAASYTVFWTTNLQNLLARDSLLVDGEMFQKNPTADLNDIARASRLTPADIKRVARQYLGPGRVVMSVIPAGKLELVSKPDQPYTNKTVGKAP